VTIDPRRLDAFFRPTSIAVVGAGERPTSSGGAVLRNLRLCGWAGRVVPVNPKGGVIQGLPAVTSLREISPPADLVAVLVRPEAILDVAREAAATGHRNLLILPGGFSEAGDVGKARDAELRAIAAAEDLLIGGPNCGGLVNVLDPAGRFAATFFRDVPTGGPVALISQSGAIAEEMISASHRDGIPLTTSSTSGRTSSAGRSSCTWNRSGTPIASAKSPPGSRVGSRSSRWSAGVPRRVARPRSGIRARGP
jgi:acetyltransferase